LHMLVFDGPLTIDTGVHPELTVTVTVNVLPIHEPRTGVTVYTAVPVPDSSVRVPDIVAWAVA
jgi:hypothetical protein